MKDSSLLKWAQNNNKNNKGKNKEEKNKNWIHPAESLTTGHIAYLVKFLGSTEVDKPKGIEVVKDGIRKLKFSQQIKKAEGTKTPKVELTVSVDGVAIQEPKTKKIQHQYPLHRISYCADDKAEKRFFSFIAKEEEEEKHTCFVFVSDKLAEEITLTIGQAFDLAYKRYMSGNNKEDGRSTPEEENIILKQRLKELSSLLTSTQLNDFLDKHNISDVCEIKEENDNRSEISNGNIKSVSMDTSNTGSDQSDDQLINLDAPVTKFDNMTLDDLNDDDFDPRAGDSDSSDDFNPRSFPTPVIKQQQTPVTATPVSNQSFGGSPAASFPPVNSFAALPQQQIVLTPPALPPRDPAKFPAKTVPNNPNNPFASPVGFGSAQDPFGMSTFSTPSEKNGVSSSVSTDVFADLDPLKK